MTGEATNKVVVYLTPEDADKFKLFMQHYEAFDRMLRSRVFEIRANHVQLHFDQNGSLKLIWMPTKFE
jgi:hypothetical protein